jgi:hypothetical protein
MIETTHRPHSVTVTHARRIAALKTHLFTRPIMWAIGWAMVSQWFNLDGDIVCSDRSMVTLTHTPVTALYSLTHAPRVHSTRSQPPSLRPVTRPCTRLSTVLTISRLPYHTVILDGAGPRVANDVKAMRLVTVNSCGPGAHVTHDSSI